MLRNFVNRAQRWLFTGLILLSPNLYLTAQTIENPDPLEQLHVLRSKTTNYAETEADEQTKLLVIQAFEKYLSDIHDQILLSNWGFPITLPDIILEDVINIGVILSSVDGLAELEFTGLTALYAASALGYNQAYMNRCTLPSNVNETRSQFLFASQILADFLIGHNPPDKKLAKKISANLFTLTNAIIGIIENTAAAGCPIVPGSGPSNVAASNDAYEVARGAMYRLSIQIFNTFVCCRDGR